jgi:hypothetical protein
MLGGEGGQAKVEQEVEEVPARIDDKERSGV